MRDGKSWWARCARPVVFVAVCPRERSCPNAIALKQARNCCSRPLSSIISKCLTHVGCDGRHSRSSLAISIMYLLHDGTRCAPPDAGLMSRKRTCPKCHSTNVRPSHRRNFLERAILPLLRLRPYRCEDCDERFLLPHSAKAGLTSNAPVHPERANRRHGVD